MTVCHVLLQAFGDHSFVTNLLNWRHHSHLLGRGFRGEFMRTTQLIDQHARTSRGTFATFSEFTADHRERTTPTSSNSDVLLAIYGVGHRTRHHTGLRVA